jgi:hypothetical protein
MGFDHRGDRSQIIPEMAYEWQFATDHERGEAAKAGLGKPIAKACQKW